MAGPVLRLDNFSGNKGPAILIEMWIFTSVAAIFVAARIYTRIKIVRAPGIDDSLIVLSLAIGYIFVGLTTGSVAAGNGKHSSMLSTDQLQRAVMLNTAGFAPGILSFVVPKLGVTALLTRVLCPTKRSKMFLWGLVGVTSLMIIGCIIIIYAQCRPMKALWTPVLIDSSCWSSWVLVDYSIAAGVISACMDLFLAVYPIKVLLKLQMNMKRKLALIVALGLGSCACVVAIYKCTRLPGLADQSDFTYSTADLVIWTNVESNTIIIAACIPTLAPLLDREQRQSVYHSQPEYNGNQTELQGFSLSSCHREPKRKVIKDDIESHEGILTDGISQQISLNGITRTDEVIVRTEDKL